nr:DUF2793 domain-containing protein [Brucella anthropi]
MDRVNGANTVDIGGGRRGFKSQNAAAGIPGTEVTDKILNDVQEEICAVIEKSGLVLSSDNQQQMWEALQSIAAPGFANRAPWLPVLSITLANPPAAPALGDAYVIPAGATEAWNGQAQKLAEWTGSSWRIVATKDGHGVSLPDGRVFERVGGVYVEKLALDAQSGKWNYAVAGGTANALTASITPAPSSYTEGQVLRIKIATKNTGAATLNLNGLGARPITRPTGMPLIEGDLPAGGIVEMIVGAASILFVGLTQAGGSTSLVFSSTGVTNWTVPAGVYRALARVWGAGGGGGGCSNSVSAASGGGGAGYAEGYISLVPGSTVPITVGVGGAGGVGSSSGFGNGLPGGSSSVGGLISATGGGPGLGSNSGVQASGSGDAGTGSGGALNLTGVPGGYAIGVSADIRIGGFGGSAPLGGGIPSITTATQGAPGTFPGGGANGAVNANPGGRGANGMIILSW